MKQPTTKQIAAQIKRNNAKFKKASPAQKRVLIARDVIKRVESKQYKANTGSWINAESAYCGAPRDSSIQPLILGGTTCEVCALGGVFMSCTALNNRQCGADFRAEYYRVGEIITEGDELANGLTEIFEPAQLCLIETAFEAGGGFGNWGRMDDFPPASERNCAVTFGRSFKRDRRRLLAIMRNIVKNKGTFRP